MSQDEAEDLYSLLAPLANGRMIVPRSCVAEIIGSSGIHEVAGAPAWLLGVVRWKDRDLPVISLEGACHREVPEASRRSRIAVFAALTDKVPGGYLGILTQGFPQLVRVNPDVLQVDNAPQYSEDEPVLCQLRMMNERPVIPDLERLEEMTSEYFDARATQY
ncbi:MAG: chemotaxis protein CheW [Gammaproteobacteria bacterium]|nr:chemotaxis protein CheW [Gammaproteobacteria bacterium]